MTSRRLPDNAPRAPRSPSWFSGRTRIITAVSIIAVGLAGATAVSANIGILDSASDSAVGNAAVTGDLATASTQVVDVYLPEAATSATTATSATPLTPSTVAATTAPPTAPPSAAGAASSAQEFAVDVAGTVAVSAGDGLLRLERVTPAAGWNWTLAQSDPAALQVTMKNGTRTFQFAAALSSDGTVAAGVTEPIVNAAPASGASAGYGSDDDDQEHEDEDHEDHDDEYEGGEDDD